MYFFHNLQAVFAHSVTYLSSCQSFFLYLQDDRNRKSPGGMATRRSTNPRIHCQIGVSAIYWRWANWHVRIYTCSLPVRRPTTIWRRQLPAPLHLTWIVSDDMSIYVHIMLEIARKNTRKHFCTHTVGYLHILGWYLKNLVSWFLPVSRLESLIMRSNISNSNFGAN